MKRDTLVHISLLLTCVVALATPLGLRDEEPTSSISTTTDTPSLSDSVINIPSEEPSSTFTVPDTDTQEPEPELEDKDGDLDKELEDKDGQEKQQPTRPIVSSSPKPEQSNTPADEHISCHEILNAQDQCQFALDHCQDYKIGFVNYVNLYYCQPSSQRWFSLIFYVLTLIILFTTLGITASEFLCPNLDTLAKIFKMSESLAGVTLLALGNGSPDVFSTLEAMKIDSPSLAIGELVGAAMFITCVVVGCMAITKPFQVNKRPFIRDTAFLLISIIVTIVFLSDRDLNVREAMVMMVLYICYVVFVVFWDWVTLKKRQALLVDQKMRNIQGSYEEGLKPNLSRFPSHVSNGNGHTQSSAGDGVMGFVDEEQDLGTFDQFESNLEEEALENFEEWKKSSSSVMIRPSLLSALDLSHKYLTSPNTELNNSPPDQISLNTLLPVSNMNASPIKASSAGLSPAGSFLKMTALPHYRDNKQTASSGATTDAAGETDSYFVPLHDVNNKLLNNAPPDILITNETNESSFLGTSSVNEAVFEDSNESNALVSDNVNGPHRTARRGSHSSQHSNISFAEELQHSNNNFNQFIQNILHNRILDDSSGLYLFFPSLQDISEKSLIDKLFTILCLPTTTLLQFTVPVINTDPGTRSIDDDLLLHRGYHFLLTRCFIAPFAATLLIGYKSETESSSTVVLGLLSLTISIALCLFVKYTADIWQREQRQSKLVKLLHFVVAFIGFIIAITWISTIATELISIIKFFSILFHLSDAILGVTVFAVGNSLSDLISNFTIAKMGFPMMALSACFGGPLLNIMLGIGCSSVYIIPQKGWDGITIDFSPTLIVSFVTVLINLIFLLVVVPLNGWWMNRTVGVTMISFWAIATVICVIIEIVGE
ncbi:hypothetical protein WICPIJ_000027 [Wickerhamomyces pijperi]|uniref:Sodium/calcium exchanger membrane region domain-containing protein n=1 Tax=Wickerhamomyces pijperi TaxID=599730 RepID=A0A9P8TR69_WICPI|nr:hypothetical protein WICPIJ_000027 [Wickerhamomyces pijperi]